MAEITASMVKELREKTDAPMMDCKKALSEAGGDMQKAEEILRVRFGNKAAKSASRVAAEGVVTIAIGADVTRDDDGRTVNAPTADRPRAVAALAERLRTAGRAVDELSLQQPTLDDVFLTLTGTHIDDQEEQA